MKKTIFKHILLTIVIGISTTACYGERIAKTTDIQNFSEKTTIEETKDKKSKNKSSWSKQTKNFFYKRILGPIERLSAFARLFYVRTISSIFTSTCHMEESSLYGPIYLGHTISKNSQSNN